MTELRSRMIRDMTVRGFSARTHEAYIRQVVGLARHYRRAPDQLSADEVQAYLAHLFQARKRSWSTCAQAAHAFRFLYHVTLGREKTAFHVPAPKQPQKLPDILSREEGSLAPAARLHPPLASTPARDHLRRRPSRQRGRGPQGRRSRCRSHDHPHLAELRQQAWVVYCKPPFAGPEHVLAYLGRYTHRVALSNERLVGLSAGRVRFRWRDYADGDRLNVMELAAEEFLRRFLLHVVPDGFVRIRHFGLLANRRRAAALAQCRTLYRTTHDHQTIVVRRPKRSSSKGRVRSSGKGRPADFSRTQRDHR